MQLAPPPYIGDDFFISARFKRNPSKSLAPWIGYTERSGYLESLAQLHGGSKPTPFRLDDWAFRPWLGSDFPGMAKLATITCLFIAGGAILLLVGRRLRGTTATQTSPVRSAGPSRIIRVPSEVQPLGVRRRLPVLVEEIS